MIALASAMLAAAEPEQTAPLWLWLATLVLGPVVIAFDLFVVARLQPRLGARAAFFWTIVWFLVGLAFAIPVATAAGEDYGIKYTTGYVLEKALTIDQVFVIALIIRTWHTPMAVGRRLVFIALTILLVLRLPFIALGYVLAENDSALLHAITSGLFVVGGIVLLRTRATHAAPQRQLAVRALARVRPVLGSYEGQSMTVVRDGKKYFTLAAVVFTALLTCDLYFDATVPLAFAFTKPPFIVLASTTFALFGIRSMYAFASSIQMNVTTLKVSLALALWLVAIDLILSSHLSHPSWLIPIFVLLIVIGPMILSYRRTDPESRDGARAGAMPDLLDEV